MYIYNKPHVHRSEEGKDAEGGAMGTEQASISHHHQSSASGHSPLPHPPLTSHPPSYPSHPSSEQPPPPAISSKPAPPERQPKSRRHSLPFSFPPLFSQPANTSSTSLVPSTAEGKPIPLDDTTAEHRTSALRELNIHYPSPVSRNRYAKSTGAQSSTYSQPVIVRTYSGPSPSQHPYQPRQYRPPSASRGGSRRVPLTAASTTGSYLSAATASRPGGIVRVSPAKNGSIVSMAGAKTKKKMPWHWQTTGSGQQEEVKLPPLEAFSFKSFMADLQAQGGEHDIGADLDRIAEICARSRYSLSNQYEVHVAPHGSGASFLAASSSHSGGRRKGGRRNQQPPGGLTLQAVSSDDDENSARAYRKRRGGGRRKSVAYGTLETIMSSSRSSEEDKTDKKSAAEIAEEVRGRAARKESGHSAATGSGSGHGGTSSSNGAEPGNGTGSAEGAKKLARKRSATFASAVIDSSRHAAHGDAASPRRSSAALVSRPAQPQASTSHLEIRTTPDVPYHDNYSEDSQPTSPHGSEGSEEHFAISTANAEEAQAPPGSLLSGLSGWMPWRSSVVGSPPGRRGSDKPSHAAGSLRKLLKSVDAKDDKGKAVAYEP